MEKRQHRRIPFRRNVYLINQDGDGKVLQSSDFSLRGMGIFCQHPAVIGEKVRLCFTVNTPGNRHALNVQGKIRHVAEMNDKFLVGINFLN